MRLLMNRPLNKLVGTVAAVRAKTDDRGRLSLLINNSCFLGGIIWI